jgi:uncharacterized protein YndB with AHSA1/START domain
MAQAMTKDKTQKLTITREFPASPERVFDALTDAQSLSQWFGPASVTARQVSVDLKPDGAYRLEMHHDDGSVYPLSGSFVEIARPRRLVMTWIWGVGDYGGVETLVSIDLEPTDEGTRLTLTHENLVDDLARERHSEGWQSSFDCLETHL